MLARTPKGLAHAIGGRLFQALPAAAGFVNCSREPLPDPHVLDIVTVAFNNPRVVSWQLDAVARHLQDPHCLTIVDNSTNREARRQIQHECDTRGSGYVGMPSWLLRGSDPSGSHGHALNWAYRKFLRPRRADFFGFLDHDIFPFRRTHVITHVRRSGAWGLVQERDHGWYLWPGFSFFSRAATEGRMLDFRPAPGLDTGGANYLPLFRDLNKTALETLEHQHARWLEGASGRTQETSYELIGDWVHTFNASDWRGTGNKDAQINEILRRLQAREDGSGPP